MSLFIASKDIYVIGPEIYLPKQVMKNQDLINWMGAKIRPKWISYRTGIEERRWAAKEEACSDLAYQAAKKLLDNNKIDKDSIDQLILSTVSGDFISPPTSPLVCKKLDLPSKVGTFDLHAACAGFVTALHMTSSMCHSSESNYLLIASDLRSKYLYKRDLSATSLFGDGAASCLVSNRKENALFKYLASELLSDGSVGDTISIPAGGTRLPYQENEDPKNIYLEMKKGATLFVKAVDGMAAGATSLLEKLNIDIEQIDWVVPHQANLHLIRKVMERLDVPHRKVIETIQFTGNTSGASVGIALYYLKAQKDIKRGQKIVLISAGGGGLSAVALLEAI